MWNQKSDHKIEDHICDPWSCDPAFQDQKKIVILWFWLCWFLWSYDLYGGIFCDPVQKNPWSHDPDEKKTRDPMISKWTQLMILWSQEEENLRSCDRKIWKTRDPMISKSSSLMILWSRIKKKMISWSEDWLFCDSLLFEIVIYVTLAISCIVEQF